MAVLLKTINLRQFDGGDGNGAGAAAEAGAIGESGAADGNHAQTDAAQQAATQQAVNTAQPDDAKNLRKEYEDAKKGKFKELFDQDVQRIINKRFRETKTLESELSHSRDVLSTLMERYGVNDIDALSKAVDEDSAFWDAYGDSLGMTGKAARADVRYRVEQKARLQAENARKSAERVNAALAKWDAEGAELAKEKTFRGFSFREEAKENPQLIDLLNAGIPMKQAYMSLHLDRFLSQAADEAEQRVVQTIRAKGMRPAENGVGGYGGITTGKEVSRLTREERKELARRSMGGERISL